MGVVIKGGLVGGELTCRFASEAWVRCVAVLELGWPVSSGGACTRNSTGKPGRLASSTTNS